MAKIQLELNDEENRKVELHKANKRFITKAQAIKDIIKSFKFKIKNGK